MSQITVGNSIVKRYDIKYNIIIVVDGGMHLDPSPGLNVLEVGQLQYNKGKAEGQLAGVT